MSSAVLENALRCAVLVEAYAALSTRAHRHRAGGGMVDAVVAELWRMGAEDHRAERDSEAT